MSGIALSKPSTYKINQFSLITAICEHLSREGVGEVGISQYDVIIETATAICQALSVEHGQAARVSALPPETCSIEWFECGKFGEIGTTECGHECYREHDDKWNYCPECGRKLRTTP